MLWLADLSATYNMPLDIHMEPDTTALAEFELLLAHNRSTKIIWDHVGWYYTDVASAEIISGLMANHSNLYLSIKLRDATTDTQLAASPLSAGTIKDAWKTLLETYPDRIMVGIDAKYSLLTADEALINTALAFSNTLRIVKNVSVPSWRDVGWQVLGVDGALRWDDLLPGRAGLARRAYRLKIEIGLHAFQLHNSTLRRRTLGLQETTTVLMGFDGEFEGTDALGIACDLVFIHADEWPEDRQRSDRFNRGHIR